MMNEILKAVQENAYEQADVLLQDYLKAAPYDDITAILDAGIGAYYGDRPRIWNAIRKGLTIDCRNHELYVLLGEYYLQENMHLSYLCYENALYHCDQPDDRNVILQSLDHIKNNYGITIGRSTIIIQSLDQLDHTRSCVESIRRTTSKDMREIVVVDHGSQDGSVEWLKGQMDILLVEVERDEGFVSGCNRGIQTSAVGSDILLLSNEMRLTENALFWLRMGLYAKEEYGTAGSVSNMIQNLQTVEGSLKNTDPFIFAERINVPRADPYESKLFLLDLALLIKRSVLDRIGILDERFSPGGLEDEDYGLRVLTEGYKNILCKNSFVVYIGQGPVCKNRWAEQKILDQNRKKLDKKWGFSTEYHLGARLDLPQFIDGPADQPLRILELGCGCGAMMGYIKALYPNAEMYGIEIVPAVARIAAHMGTVFCGDVEDMEIPWDDEFFDYIIMGDVLEHLMTPDTVLQKLRKHLKTGGHILVSMPNVKHYSVILPLLKWDVFPYSDHGILDRTHVKMYTGVEIQDLLMRNGYRVEIGAYNQYGSPSEEEMQMLDQICTLMKLPSKESFLAFQYLFKAVKDSTT